MRESISEAALERVVSAAYAALRGQGGLTPYFIIEDLIGLHNYRRAQQCPDTETLAAYAEDALPLDTALRIAVHENRCPVCRADVADMRRVAQQQLGRLFASMPAWTTPFVGRDEMRERLGGALSGRGASMVTVAAAGGTGKTRLCLETAVERSDLFPDGVWYVPLSGRRDAGLAATEIARAAQIQIMPDEAPIEQLRDYFAGRRGLLILDDVSTGSPVPRLLVDLLEGSPDLRCLATAPEALGVADETVLKLPPMPALLGERDPETLLSAESIRLFTEHVHTFEPGFRFEEADLRRAAAICDRAAGMPLGIELAAARAREMPLEEIAQRLGPRRGPEESPGESLRDLIAWSYGLLSGREQRFLERLSVFEGGFLAEQAADVCEAEDAREMLEALERQELLQCSERPGNTRYRLLTPVQEFARERLGNNAVPTLRRHVAHFLHYSQERAARLEDDRQVAAREELSADLPNLRAGMDRARDLGDLRATGEYGLALRRFFYLEGLWQEGVDRLRASEEAFASTRDGGAQRRTWLALARLLTQKGDYDEAESLFRRVLEEAEERGDAALVAEAEHGLGNVAQYLGHYPEASRYLERALAYFEAADERWSAATMRANLAWLAEYRGDAERAETLYKQALEVLRERGDRYIIGITLANLGNVAFDDGRLDEALDRYAECLRVRQDLGDVRGVASAIGNIGHVWHARGDYPRAEYCYAEAARRYEQLGDRRGMGRVLGLQGCLALDQGDGASARRQLEASLRTLEAAGDVHEAAVARGDLGRVALHEGREIEALRLYRESLSRLRDLGDRAGMGLQVARIGALLWARGGVERGVLLLCGSRLLRANSHEADAALAEAERHIGAEQLAYLRGKAEAMTSEEVITQALSREENDIEG